MTDLAIVAKKLNKSFNGKPAVIGLDLEVRKGEVFGFLGPNGSGKTTTIRMLCGLLLPDSGEGNCLGYDIVTQTHLIRPRVGYMTQAFSLYTDLTVRENLVFVARSFLLENYSERVEKIMHELDLYERKDQLIGTLSGGWKQRLSLAIALLHDPELLLLDEPTAGVDVQSRSELWDLIHHIAAQGITVLVTTHYMDEAERCHRLGYIDRGQLQDVGTAKELVQRSGLHTWLVTGPHLTLLKEKLLNEPGVEQAIIFGHTLRVSSKDQMALEKSIKTYKRMEGYHWEQIETALEDIFISSEVNVAATDTREQYES